MRILKDLEEVATLREPLFLTFGFFDGFHAGHRLILRRLLSYCSKYSKHYGDGSKKARSLVVTFETLPVGTGARKHIYPIATKLWILQSMGIDYCLILNFTEVRQINYRRFLDYFFSAPVLGLVASDKLCLGYRRKGTPELVKRYFAEQGSRAIILPSLKTFSKIDPLHSQKTRMKICSTDIRELFRAGKIYQANQKLELPFHVIGKVKPGKAWGRKIGFPTINFPYPADSVEIPLGSYVTVTVVDKKTYFSMSYVGIPFSKKDKTGEKKPIVETYLLNFSKSVYNNKVTVYFIKNLEENKQIENLTGLQIFLENLKNRLEKYIEKKPVFFQKKLEWIKQTLR